MWTLLTISYISVLSICLFCNDLSVSWLFRIILILTWRFVLKLFLRFGKIWGSCSHKIILMKKTCSMSGQDPVFFRKGTQARSQGLPKVQKFYFPVVEYQLLLLLLTVISHPQIHRGWEGGGGAWYVHLALAWLVGRTVYDIIEVVERTHINVMRKGGLVCPTSYPQIKRCPAFQP